MVTALVARGDALASGGISNALSCISSRHPWPCALRNSRGPAAPLGAGKVVFMDLPQCVKIPRRYQERDLGMVALVPFALWERECGCRIVPGGSRKVGTPERPAWRCCLSWFLISLIPKR